MIEDGLGFMGFWSDIESNYLSSYQEWHNCEHMPERVSIPGFVEGRRYRGADSPTGPRFFMCYVTETPDVLDSDAYLAALNRPTPWTLEALTRFRNPARTLYRRIASAGSAPVHRPYLALLRFDDDRPASELAPVLNAAVTGSQALAASLFEINATASGIMTAERKIYSGGPAKQQFLVAVEGHYRARVVECIQSVQLLLGPRIRDPESWVYWQEARVRAIDVRSDTLDLEERVA